MKLLLLVLLSLSLNLFSATKKISPESQIGFEIVKYKIAKVVEGKFDSFNGTIDLDEQKSEIKNVAVKIKTASINTGNEKRDGHLKSPDFFNAQEHQEIAFVSTQSTKIASNFKLKGKLTMNGVTKDVLLNVERKNNNRFVGKTTINKLDYNIKWNKPLEKDKWTKVKGVFGKNVIGNEVDIVLDIKLN